MNIIGKTLFSKLGIVLLVSIIVIAGMTYWRDNDRISKNFAEQLFKYPLPPKTKVIEKEQVNGKYLVWSNSGNWGVIASVRLSTKLSKEEILLYYQKAGLFKFPKSDKRGVEPEIYFQGDFQKVKRPEGFYYTAKDGGSNPLTSYFVEERKKGEAQIINGNSAEEMEYVVQITSDFDYFLNLDSH